MLLSVWDHIVNVDKHIWYYLNVQWRCEWLDLCVPYLREPKTWIPLYLFLLIAIPYRFGKVAIWWCLGFLLTFALCDYTSASIIKPMVQRLRPCNDLELRQTVRLLVDCGSGYSFPSSHASNHFGMAVFMIGTLRRFWRWISIPLLLWAASIAYAQVYVGVHFPLDTFCGALLGSIIGALVAWGLTKRLGKDRWHLKTAL